MATNTASHSFEYQGWNVTVLLDRIDCEGVVSGHAELRVENAESCRISLVTPHHDGASALIDLASRARGFIDQRGWTSNEGLWRVEAGDGHHRQGHSCLRLYCAVSDSNVMSQTLLARNSRELVC